LSQKGGTRYWLRRKRYEVMGGGFLNSVLDGTE
jgi:hypothetical protein